MNKPKSHAGAHCWYAAGDCLASLAVGVATAAAVRLVVTPRWDMVVAMIAGMTLGTLIHLAVGLALSPLLGAIEAMAPSGVTGMYGGMYFAMRDAMHPEQVAMHHAVAVGAVFGVVAFAGVTLYHRAIRGVVFDATGKTGHE